MSNPSFVSLQLVAAVSNGIAQSQTPGAAGNLTLNGSLVTAGIANMDVPRRVAITSTGADSAIVFTITGTNGVNGTGAPINETLTGINAATTGVSKYDYGTVTKISVSGATAGAIVAGTNGTASTPWVLDNFLAPFWALAVMGRVVTGSATWSVEHTYDDPNTPSQQGVTPAPAGFSMEPASFSPPFPILNPTLQAQTGTGEYQYQNWPIMAHRLTISAGTGKVTMQSIQAGIGSP